MAITVTHALQFLAEKYTAEHDVESAILKLILMDDTFTFDMANHKTYADVSGSELAGGSGYTNGGHALSTVSVATVDTGDTSVLVNCDDLEIVASGESIPATAAAIVYNSSHANDTLMLCIEFGTTYITPDGKSLYFNFSNGLSEGIPRVT